MKELKKLSDIPTLLEKYRSKALFFDLDGTLIHSEPLHIQAVVYTLVEFDQSVKISELMTLQQKGINEKLTGVNDYRVYEIIAEELGRPFKHSIDGLIAAKNDFLKGDEVSALIKSPQCFKKEFHQILKNLSQSYELALVSASQRDFVDHVLKTLQIKDFFKIVIAREDTEETKPDSAPYLLAMKNLKLNKQDVLIFEDSETGLISAKASGANVVKVSWY